MMDQGLFILAVDILCRIDLMLGVCKWCIFIGKGKISLLPGYSGLPLALFADHDLSFLFLIGHSYRLGGRNF